MAPAGGGARRRVEFWFWADDPYQASLHTDSLKKFEAMNPKITVKTDLITTVADQRKKLLTAFAAQAGMPDFSHAPGGWVPEYYDAKMIVPLEARLKSWKTYDDWLPAIQKLATGGRSQDPPGIVVNQVLIPYLYYRADWLAAAKLKPPGHAGRDARGRQGAEPAARPLRVSGSAAVTAAAWASKSGCT